MGTLYIVATPIGNLGDVSNRMLQTLKEVDLIAAEDTRQTIKILNYFQIKKPMISYHKFNEKQRSNEIIEKLNKGLNIALVSDAGTPCISDPGYILIKEAKENGINVIGIPGPSALINALAISGIQSDMFAFYGFFSTDNTKFKQQIKLIEESAINTFIIYESPNRIVKTVEKIKTYFPNSIVSISSDMTKKFERNFYGQVEEVFEKISKDENITKGEYTIVINKKTKESPQKIEFSLEALIIDSMIKNKCNLKEAIKKVKDSNQELKKNEIYSASLRLREILRED